MGVLRLRRTSHQWCPPGACGAARGGQRQSYQRDPVVPSPALRRVHPSAGRLARIAFTWRGCEPSPTEAWPDTART